MINEEKLAMSVLYADMANGEIYYTPRDMKEIRTHIGSIMQVYGLQGATLKLVRDDVVSCMLGDEPPSSYAAVCYGALCMAARIWGHPPIQDDGIAQELSNLYREIMV